MITKKCKDCGKEFTLTDGEIEFYRSKGFDLPNRCKSCRDRRKGQKTSSAPPHNNNGRNKKSKSAVPAVLIAAFLLIVLILKVSDVIIPERSSLPETTYTSVYTSETTTSAAAEIVITTAETTRSSDITTMITTEESTAAYSETAVSTTAQTTTTTAAAEPAKPEYHFRNATLLEEHYEKHGIDMGFSSAAEYEAAASAVVTSPQALHKLEKEDNDDVYYIESTNEFVIVSTDGYIRTYFSPDSGKDYFDKQ